jgi:hypothetical protein
VTTIPGVVARDIRFPTSLDLSGSDAMNEAPCYSAEMKPESLNEFEVPTGGAWTKEERSIP